MSTPNIIKPTIGRIVWYNPSPADVLNQQPIGMLCEHMRQISTDQLLAATICYVWSDTMVNLDVIDHAGTHHIRQSVTLLQEGAENVVRSGCFAQWMPFQLNQALLRAVEAISDQPREGVQQVDTRPYSVSVGVGIGKYRPPSLQSIQDAAEAAGSVKETNFYGEGDTYEAGVNAALRWTLGQTDKHPLSSD